MYRTFAVLVAVATGWASPAASGQDGPTVPEPPAEFRFEAGARGESYLNLSIVAVDQQSGRPGAVAVETTVHLYHNRLPVLNYKVTFDRLHEGDLFPVLGRLYRVGHMGSEDGPKGRKNAWMLAKRLDPKDVPAGVTLRAKSVVVPHTPGEFGATTFAPGPVQFVEYQSEAAGYNPPRARLRVPHRDGWGEVRVRAGDVVLLAGMGYEVLSVTPPDAKTKVIGWVELAPEGVPEDELVKKKVPVVRPEAVEKDKK